MCRHQCPLGESSGSTAFGSEAQARRELAEVRRPGEGVFPKRLRGRHAIASHSNAKAG